MGFKKMEKKSISTKLNKKKKFFSRIKKLLDDN